MKLILSSIIVLFSLHSMAQDFIVKPYLQIGSKPSTHALQLLWHAEEANWLVEYKSNASMDWRKAEEISTSKITTTGVTPFTIYNASLNSLVSGNKFYYRVSKNNKIVFTAEGKAPKSETQAFRFVASGDMGAGTKEAKQIANGMYNANPDFVTISGDIVYDYGLISEYKTKFWPIYNTDKVDAEGVPLMRSIPFVAAVGNHDADTRDLDKYPDALAYYLFWDQPLNGPVGEEGGKFVPVLKGNSSNVKAFKDGAGDKYPRMVNYSFNYGNAHFTVLDADTYVDWTDSIIKAWVANDLATAKESTWKFVLFHHPGFNSSREHFEQQQMRLLSPIFEKGNVDIVLMGHVHNYQRSFPMTFVPDKNGTLLVGGKENKTIRGRVVSGKWTLDKKFDSKNYTKPKGVIYIVTGAGGQSLYNPEQNNDPDSWQKFTNKFISNIHSFTQIDVNGKTLTLKQIDVNGKEIDEMEIKK